MNSVTFYHVFFVFSRYTACFVKSRRSAVPASHHASLQIVLIEDGGGDIHKAADKRPRVVAVPGQAAGDDAVARVGDPREMAVIPVAEARHQRRAMQHGHP